MKYLIITINLIFFNLKIQAQEKNFNPYNEVLKEYLTESLEDKMSKDIISFEILENEVSKNLMESLNFKGRIIKIRLINEKELIKNKVESIIEIRPISSVDENLSIDIITFEIEVMKRKRINFMNAGGMRYDLKFDCNTGNYYIKKNDAFKSE